MTKLNKNTLITYHILYIHQKKKTYYIPSLSTIFWKLGPLNPLLNTDVISSIHKQCTDLPRLQLLFDEVFINFDVICLILLNWVLSDTDFCLIITIQIHWALSDNPNSVNKPCSHWSSQISEPWIWTLPLHLILLLLAASCISTWPSFIQQTCNKLMWTSCAIWYRSYPICIYGCLKSKTISLNVQKTFV